MGEPGAVLRGPEELSAEWLAHALGTGPVASFEVTAIGTGQMSESRRVRIEYAEGGGPLSVVLKTASADENSRAAGVGLGVYEREVRFYRELAPRIGGPLADCHLAAIDAEQGWFTLLLEDVAPASQGDQIAGCTVEDARLAVRELARLHAPVLGDPQLGATPWLNQEGVLSQAMLAQLLPAFLERYGDRVSAAHREVCERFVASLDGWSARREPPLGLVHGDYRLDNMLFGTGEGAPPFVAVDWQTVGWGPVMTDLAYFLGGSLQTEDRRRHEQELVREYHQTLGELGVPGFGWEECWSGYRRQAFLGILMTVAPAMLVERTDRGDQMFLTTLARYSEQILDLGSLELLPPAGSGRPPALRPQPDEEGRHDPGPEQLWNESWYFDAISEDGGFGLYTRLGLYPNLGVAWITAIACGPGRPTVAAIDFAAPLPAPGELDVQTSAGLIEHRCEQPLDRFRVRLEHGAQAHADPAALLRGEQGSPVELAFDLVWETVGEPYAYRVATRYEIPCRVAGVVRIGEKEIRLSGPGQRDHSWGPRDWWSAEWMWSAGQLGDGTRLHGVEFRLPDAPPLGVGYLQPAEGGVDELDAVRAREEVTADGLIAAASVDYGELAVDVQPLAFGPLRLEAPDGRVSFFPRAMCRLVCADGRTGLGWLEWNRNRSAGAGGAAGG
jgi:hypothetical protein